MAENHETERYRKATHLALEQLDWCIEYLRSIGKPRISAQLAKNRSSIVQRLVRQANDRRSRT